MIGTIWLSLPRQEPGHGDGGDDAAHVYSYPVPRYCAHCHGALQSVSERQEGRASAWPLQRSGSATAEHDDPPKLPWREQPWNRSVTASNLVRRLVAPDEGQVSVRVPQPNSAGGPHTDAAGDWDGSTGGGDSDATETYSEEERRLRGEGREGGEDEEGQQDRLRRLTEPERKVRFVGQPHEREMGPQSAKAQGQLQQRQEGPVLGRHALQQAGTEGGRSGRDEGSGVPPQPPRRSLRLRRRRTDPTMGV